MSLTPALFKGQLCFHLNRFNVSFPQLKGNVDVSSLFRLSYLYLLIFKTVTRTLHILWKEKKRGTIVMVTADCKVNSSN